MIKKRKFNNSNNPIVYRPMVVYNDRGVNIEEEVDRQMSQQLPPLKSDVVTTTPEVVEESIDPNQETNLPNQDMEIEILEAEEVSESSTDKNSDKKLLYGVVGFGIAVFLFLINND